MMTHTRPQVAGVGATLVTGLRWYQCGMFLLLPRVCMGVEGSNDKARVPRGSQRYKLTRSEAGKE
jgi:hypothetical protein